MHTDKLNIIVFGEYTICLPCRPEYVNLTNRGAVYHELEYALRYIYRSRRLTRHVIDLPASITTMRDLNVFDQSKTY